MRKKITEFWHKADGFVGALLLLLAAVIVTSLVKDNFYKTEREALYARIGTVRLEERASAESKLNVLRQRSLERDKTDAEQTKQLNALLAQNGVLIEMMRRATSDRKTQMQQAITSADSAAQAVKRLDRKLDDATLPKAVTPVHTRGH